VVEAFEEAVEDLLPGELSLVFGVVSLGLRCWPELDRGDEEGAGSADRLEVTVGLDGSGAVAVAEHAAVHLAAQFAHLGALVVAGQLAWLAVERFDFLGDAEVLLGNGFVGYSGIDHRHREGLVAEKGSDRVDAHAAVDRLGCQCVAELVGGDVADPGFVDSRLSAVATRNALIGRLCSISSLWDRRSAGRWLAIQSSSISLSCGCSGM